jgi:hypothetical protein
MNRIKTVLIAALFAVGSSAAFGQTSASGVNHVEPVLKVTATVATAVQLTLSTDTQCTVTTLGPTHPDYSMDFGNVNSLGLGTPNCGSVLTGTNAAIYWSKIKLTPTFTGFASISGTHIDVSTTGFGVSGLTVEGPKTTNQAMPTVFGDFADVTSSPATILNGGSITSGSATESFIGVKVDSTATTGAQQQALVTYTLTVS